MSWLADGSILLATEQGCQRMDPVSGATIGEKRGAWTVQTFNGQACGLQDKEIEFWTFSDDWECAEKYSGIEPWESLQVTSDCLIRVAHHGVTVVRRGSGEVAARLDGEYLGLVGTGTNLVMLDRGVLKLWSPLGKESIPVVQGVRKACVARCGAIALLTDTTLELWAAWPPHQLWALTGDHGLESLSPNGHHLFTGAGWFHLIYQDLPERSERGSFLDRLAEIRDRMTGFENLSGA